MMTPPMTNGDSNTNQNEWDIPVGLSPDQVRCRAAMLVWIIGAIEVAIFGCLSTALGLWSTLPPDQLRQAADQGGLADYQLDLFIRMQPLFVTWAITLLVLGFVPGVVYLIAGFCVRKGGSFATGAALLLASTQCIVLGARFMSQAMGAVQAHNPGALTVLTLTLGSLVTLLGFGTYWLWRGWQLARNKPQPHEDL